MKGYSYSRPARKSRYFIRDKKYIHQDAYNVRECNKDAKDLLESVKYNVWIIKNKNGN